MRSAGVGNPFARPDGFIVRLGRGAGNRQRGAFICWTSSSRRFRLDTLRRDRGAQPTYRSVAERPGWSAMSENAFEKCPRCGTALDPGFAAKNIGLSFVTPEKFEHFAFLDEDLAKSGLRKLLPWKAEYFRSYLCRSCELCLIDFGATLDRGQAEQIVRSMRGEGGVGNSA
jgi:hypothetical protein